MWHVGARDPDPIVVRVGGCGGPLSSVVSSERSKIAFATSAITKRRSRPVRSCPVSGVAPAACAAALGPVAVPAALGPCRLSPEACAGAGGGIR